MRLGIQPFLPHWIENAICLWLSQSHSLARLVLHRISHTAHTNKIKIYTQRNEWMGIFFYFFAPIPLSPAEGEKMTTTMRKERQKIARISKFYLFSNKCLCASSHICVFCIFFVRAACEIWDRDSEKKPPPL